MPLGSAIRLVKGAYLEPPTVAYPKKADVDANYFKLAARLLQDDNTRPGALLHIATHDIALQERLQQVIAERSVDQEPLRVRDALRHPDRRASRSSAAAACTSAASSATASTGSRGTCGGLLNGPLTSGLS